MTKTKRNKPMPIANLATVHGGFVTAEITMVKLLTPEQIAGDESAALVVDNGSGMCK